MFFVQLGQNYIYKIVVILRVKAVCATGCYSKRGLLLSMKIEQILRNTVSSLANSKFNSNICFKGNGQNLEVFSCQLYQSHPVFSHLGLIVLNLLLYRGRGTVQSMLFTDLSTQGLEVFCPPPSLYLLSAKRSQSPKLHAVFSRKSGSENLLFVLILQLIILV